MSGNSIQLVVETWQHQLAEAVQIVAPRLEVPRDAGAVKNAPLVLDRLREQGLTVDEESRILARFLDVPFLESLADSQPSAEFVERIPIGFARQFHCLGLAREPGPLRVVLSGSAGWAALDTLARSLDRTIEPVFAPREQVRILTNRAYEGRTGQTEKVLATLDSPTTASAVIDGLREDLLDSSRRAPVIQLVNALLFEAVTALASDIHIQPYEDGVVARLRIDGVLHDAHRLPRHVQEELVSRIKVIGRMNIAEKRLPQDGRATVQVGDRLIDLRIASMPTSHGERVVIRLLDKSARLYSLSELGMSNSVLERFRRLIRLEHGMILVTGPTGSGKSTTLYSALREINSGRLNVVTLEDPIEYQLDGISQTQINTRKGMTFASGLRSVLRQDPDIIMIGEIRDHETAVMAIQSALTGHLVFSTLHTNDAASAITRLLDLGIEPYLVASSLLGVLAQRLVRRNCQKCLTDFRPEPADLLTLEMELSASQSLKRGTGCPDCRGTGYRGRFSISELLVLNDAIRQQIQSRSNASQILATARQSGMQLMRDDGVGKILSGVTTIEEVARVTVNAST